MPDTTDAILLVEDSEDDLFFIKRTLKLARIINPLMMVADGREAIDYLGGIGAFSDRALYPYPGVIFLDLNMPYRSGFDVLRWLKEHPDLPKPRVFVLSTSLLSSDREIAAGLGATAYLVKPPEPAVLEQLAQDHGFQWLKAPAK